MRIKMMVVSLVAGLVASTGVAQQANANTTPQQGLADLFSVFIWSSPAPQEQSLCAAFKKKPARIATQVQRSSGSAASLRTQLGLTNAQFQAAAVRGVRNACASSPNPVVGANAVAGVLGGILATLPAADVAAVCTQFTADQASVISRFAQDFNTFPVPAAEVTSGVTSGLQSTCASQ